MFWVENLVFLTYFLLYEFFILFMTYGKVYLNILRASEGLYTKIFYIGMWMFLGILILIWFIGYDMVSIIRILCMHNGCRQYLDDEETEVVDDTHNKMEVYNQIRDTMEHMYNKAKREVQETIMVGKNHKEKDPTSMLNKAQNVVSRNNASPAPSQYNNSVMSKVKSVIEEKTEFSIIGIDAEILADYHQFFVERKQAIIDQWEKDQSELRLHKKHKRNENKGILFQNNSIQNYSNPK